ncbi:hypothetical protein IAU59_000207 [Kwoniella sp. CBS 9459]
MNPPTIEQWLQRPLVDMIVPQSVVSGAALPATSRGLCDSDHTLLAAHGGKFPVRLDHDMLNQIDSHLRAHLRPVAVSAHLQQAASTWDWIAASSARVTRERSVESLLSAHHAQLATKILSGEDQPGVATYISRVDMGMAMYVFPESTNLLDRPTNGLGEFGIRAWTRKANRLREVAIAPDAALRRVMQERTVLPMSPIIGPLNFRLSDEAGCPDLVFRRSDGRGSTEILFLVEIKVSSVLSSKDLDDFAARLREGNGRAILRLVH